ncbi:hypothetical protein PYW08_006931 [Mythimna loreyi]|uniref:Uncharacterized protein n=1 Tax=Mythimna loreyi TaxID=667449 RepID=A0ACC2R8A3_9NEOP|nr:hypothetical protein PYW08_006931 [Mythimna loreyi]
MGSNRSKDGTMHQKLIESYSDVATGDEAPYRGDEMPPHDNDVDEAPRQRAGDEEPHRQDLPDEEPRRRHRGFGTHQRASDYQLGLTARLDDETRTLAHAALERGRELTASSALEVVAEALRLRIQLDTLPPLHVLTLTGCWPELTFAGAEAAQVAQTALDYVRRALEDAPPGTQQSE